MKKNNNLLDAATSCSLKSEVDLFSKFEVHFLEKYMRCILADQFGDFVVNVYEEYFYRKLQTKIAKTVGMSLFEAKSMFTLSQMIRNMTEYFKQKSTSVGSGMFAEPLKIVYSNQKNRVTQIKTGELIYVDVKIRVEVARIEQIPQNIQTLLQKFNAQSLQNNDKKFQQLLLNNKGQYFNIFVFFYGDIHFNFNRPQYQTKTIKFGKKQQKLRIFSIFISKTALFQSFKSTNRVNVQCINDLVISFYDIKRQKKLIAKHKKKPKLQNDSQLTMNSIPDSSKPFDFKLVVGAGSAICIGIMLIKIFC